MRRTSRPRARYLLTYEYVKPGEEKPIRKVGYAVSVPGWNMYLGTGAYLDDLDAKLKPIEWLLGLWRSSASRSSRAALPG